MRRVTKQAIYKIDSDGYYSEDEQARVAVLVIVVAVHRSGQITFSADFELPLVGPESKAYLFLPVSSSGSASSPIAFPLLSTCSHSPR